MRTVIAFFFIWNFLFATERFEEKEATVVDHKTERVWQMSDDGVKRTFNDALEYCKKLMLSGSQGWRLPTIEELSSLTDTNDFDPSSATYLLEIKSSYYWSKTETAWDSKLAWSLYFNDGNSYFYKKSDQFYVLCVKDKKE